MYEMRNKITERLILVLCLLFLGSTQSAFAGCSDKRSPGMDWSGCKKTNKMLDDSNFAGSRFNNANLALSNLDESNFTGASLIKVDMTRASAMHSQFEDADMTKAVGYRAHFDHSQFVKTRLDKSEFSRATFIKAVIKDVDWSRSELGRANFSNAQLDNVKFEFSNLSRVQFANSQLNNVDFSGSYTYRTHFEDADLSRVKGLTQVQLEISCGNDKTQLPGSLSKPENWPCSEYPSVRPHRHMPQGTFFYLMRHQAYTSKQSIFGRMHYGTPVQQYSGNHR